MNLILLIICSCLLFGAGTTKRAIGCFFKFILICMALLLVLGMILTG